MDKQAGGSKRRIPLPKGAGEQGESSFDPLSRREAEAFQNEDYEDIVLQGETARGERFREVANWIAIIGATLIGSALILSALVWFWHLLAPPCLHYLEEGQVTQIQTVLFSGLLAGIAQSYLGPRLNPEVKQSNRRRASHSDRG
ncbi:MULTISPECIES: hypothetical protein [Halorhodospira]|uniref:hypothetical protein n=1 Tax=Halorhodospira TaxID=85108 RepID=UPI001EE7CFA2|nr:MULTISPECIES: hypothetical protein [Halorhodospira]MCG5526890.1 hypothetical protein [Halorhodospira halophila]MCG5542773.1 hypothetical protein [Halorhodospira sp. 9628]